MKGRVRKVRADLAESEKRAEVLSARIRAISGGDVMMLNLEQLDMVSRWYSWAQDAGEESAFSPQGRDLMERIEAILDTADIER